MSPRTKDLLKRLDSITFDDLIFDNDDTTFENDGMMSNDDEIESDDVYDHGDYFEYYSDAQTSSASSSHSSNNSMSDSFSRSSDTSISDLSSQYDSFKHKQQAPDTSFVQDHSIVRIHSISSKLQRVEVKPPVPPRDSPKHFNHGRFQRDLSIMADSMANNSNILDCIHDMLEQENEAIMNQLDLLVQDITTSVANNTYIVNLNPARK